MRQTQTPEFAHRFNDDALLIHSYCSRCFVDVATSTSRTEVETKEREHKCDPRLLELVEQYMKVSHLRSAA